MDTLKKMQKISIIWGMLLISLFAVLITVSVKYKQKMKKYDEVKTILEKKTREYVNDKSLYPVQSEYIKIVYGELNDQGYLKELSVDDEECDGYVIVEYNGDIFIYDTYITCPNYTSRGYDKY